MVPALVSSETEEVAMTQVSDWMSQAPICVSLGTPLARAAILMARHDIRHLPVVGARGELRGVVVDYAVFGRGVLVGGSGELWFPYRTEQVDAEVDEILERVELVVTPDADLGHTLQQLVSAGQDVVVAIDKDRVPIGLLTEHDAVRYAAALLEEDRAARMDASRPVATAMLSDDLASIHREMLERWIRHMVVVDGQGAALAVVSYRDVVAAQGHLDDDATVAEAVGTFQLVTRPVSGARTVDCARLMAKLRIGCVPLLDEDRRPVAIVTRTDVADAVAHVFEEEGLFDMA